MNNSLPLPRKSPPLSTAILSPPGLYEVWGDTVSGQHLAKAVVIGIVISLTTFALAQWVLRDLVESVQMAKAYSMLIGIIGCLAGGAICACLFKPKREVIEHVADPAFREQVVADLLKEYGTLGRLEDVSPYVIEELRQLELYDLFADAQAREEDSGAQAAEPAHAYQDAKVAGGDY